MGSGDWNDGMNRVGREGRGESVWLGFFLFTILNDFIPVVEAREDSERLARYRKYLGQLRIALTTPGGTAVGTAALTMMMEHRWELRRLTSAV